MVVAEGYQDLRELVGENRNYGVGLCLIGDEGMRKVWLVVSCAHYWSGAEKGKTENMPI